MLKQEKINGVTYTGDCPNDTRWRVITARNTKNHKICIICRKGFGDDTAKLLSHKDLVAKLGTKKTDKVVFNLVTCKSKEEGLIVKKNLINNRSRGMAQVYFNIENPSKSQVNFIKKKYISTATIS